MGFDNAHIESLTKDNLKNDATFLRDNPGPITVMATEMRFIFGDCSSTLKIYHSLVNFCVMVNNGTAVKKSKNKTLSSFDNPANAVEAGVLLQEKIDAYNMKKNSSEEIMAAKVKIGSGAFHENLKAAPNISINETPAPDSLVSFGEIFISEDAYHAVKARGRFDFRLEKEIKISEKKAPMKLFKVLFDPHEIGAHKKQMTEQNKALKKAGTENRYKFLITTVAIPVLLVVIVTIISWYSRNPTSLYKKYSITHSVDYKAEGSNQRLKNGK